MRISIAKPEQFLMTDPIDGALYGCDQDWYQTPWQRMSGCGPSTASNLLFYFLRTGRIKMPIVVKDKTDFILLMNKIWDYVTPTSKGLFRLKPFCTGVNKIFEEIHSSLQCNSLDIPNQGKVRPDFSTVVDFISIGLSKDSPVAFLNLSKGTLKNLDDWHWVTVIALDKDPDENTIILEIYDNGKSINVNLAEWFESTTHGGGFIYFA